ncbi:MAG: DUF134 domain-containing protein [Candidatus Thorarchaeota archaeon]|jgi:predicted DNA-binding protein (UPF0251 family)
MARPKRRRKVLKEPPVSVYKPAGIPAMELEEILITVDEFEAIRLADFEEMGQREASDVMHISQPTFNRTLASARRKVARGLVEGCVLRIEGGKYILSDGTGGLECVDCGSSLNMKSADLHTCPKCGSTKLRWARWKADND